MNRKKNFGSQNEWNVELQQKFFVARRNRVQKKVSVEIEGKCAKNVVQLVHFRLS